MPCLAIEDDCMLTKDVQQSAPRSLAVCSEKSGSLLREVWQSAPRSLAVCSERTSGLLREPTFPTP